MSEEKSTYSDFVSAAMEFLASRPESNVIILVEGQKGFETFRNSPGVAWSLGALRMADEMLTEKLREARNPEIEEEINRQEQERIDNCIRMGKGKVN